MKIYIGLLSITFCSIVYSDEDIISPDIQKYLILNDSVFTDYKNTKNKITYTYIGLQDNLFWYMGCSKTIIKGLPTVDCLILSKDNRFAMHVAPEGTMVLFDRENFVKSNKYLFEVNYRIDGKPMQTLPSTIITPSAKTNSFIASLLKANRFNYSIKSDNKYASYQYDLRGLDLVYGLAKEIVELNN
ncbi:hypothetical protein KTI62_13020 [Acinetobacter schindleri]|uniref:hypothetical protein n=2 Tax=Acinetobacter TaxID=469 RepID=UPI0021CDE4F3|nr:hypothetical protein [Acinetobacter schindleri]MCU4521082.1 hypothetical protein [Acinetobacter schindleri]